MPVSEAPLVGIIMGSRSDWETMRHAAETLDELGVPYETEVVSAHRTPDKLFAYAEAAESRGLQVIIAGAGGAAHLPGMTSSKTLLPVLGVPVESKTLQGLDSLLSIVQMPAGVPVGTLAIGRAGAVNAALLAAAIVARGDEGVRERLAAYRASQTESVLAAPDPVGVTALVGCIGGGQLGRMLALAGAPLDVRFRFLDPSPDACAGDVGELLVGPYDDPELLDRLADGADAVTYEFENVPVEAARRVGAVPDAARARARPGSPRREGALPQPRHPDRAVRLARGQRAARAREVTRLGYDGKGQRVVESLGRSTTTSSRRRSFRSIASCRSSRRAAATARRPSTRSPRTSTEAGSSRSRALPRRDAPQREAEEIATKLLDALGYVGVLAVELFEVDGTLLANEFAPRVHNTGHWTIDGAETSQFENHVRAVLGLPLGSTEALGESVMVNLVGDAPPLERLLAVPARTSTCTGRRRGRAQARPRDARRRRRRCDRRGRQPRRRGLVRVGATLRQPAR